MIYVFVVYIHRPMECSRGRRTPGTNSARGRPATTAATWCSPRSIFVTLRLAAVKLDAGA